MPASLPAFSPPPHDTLDHACRFLQQLHEAETAALAPGFNVSAWVAHRTRQMDAILQALYQEFFPDRAVTLFALGGYGRGELFPRSDIDLLILRPANPAPKLEKRIEAFVQALWRLGPDIAQQVSDAAACLQQAKTDTDTLTSLLEARFIAGDARQAQAIAVNTPPLIPYLDFITAKLREQHSRDSRQEHMGRLEPNIKIAPGSLRDVHMIVWVLAYCYGQDAAKQLAGSRGLTEAERHELLENRDILWRIRYALHLLGGSDKDRLRFERQKRLAAIFAYQDSATSSATEQFMRHYYQATRRVRRISRLIVKLVESEHLPQAPVTPLDRHYCIRAGRIDLQAGSRATFFQSHPQALWSLFAHLQNHPELDGLHPLLARALYEARDTLVTHSFRTDEQMRRGFLAILNHPGDVYRQVRRMLRYGILYRYIPHFWHIVGRMQYDLFHQYTVDQHTLRVLAILDHFKHSDDPAYPHAHTLMQQLDNRAILYLAAIFHDIGKGYHGDHSDIGAAMIESFALENDAIAHHDVQRLAFLVQNHLLMSNTAQKKDLSDPEVITCFARTVANRANLDLLYLLTLADISATNSNLWNSWRAALLSTLYHLSAAELEEESTALPAHLKRNRHNARQALTDIPPPVLNALWDTLPDAFFLGESSANIAAKTRDLLQAASPHRAIAFANLLYIRSRHRPDILFARTTHFLERHSLDIVEARLYQNRDKTISFQQYTLADSIFPLSELTDELTAYLASDTLPPPHKKRLQPAKLRHFPTPTHIHISHDAGRSVLELTCQDRHGLLSTISCLFLAHGVQVEHAKIATFGEKVQDVFYLSEKLAPAALEALRKALYHALQS